MAIFAKKQNCKGDVTFVETPDGYYVCTVWSEKAVIVMDIDQVKKCIKALEAFDAKVITNEILS